MFCQVLSSILIVSIIYLLVSIRYLRVHCITQHHSALVLSGMKNSSSTAIRTDLPAHKSPRSVNRKTVANMIQICKYNTMPCFTKPVLWCIMAGRRWGRAGESRKRAGEGVSPAGTSLCRITPEHGPIRHGGLR